MKKTDRIIIDCYGVSPLDALNHVRSVVHQGKISQTTKDVKHYCWVVKFCGSNVVVSTRIKKKGQTSDSFMVYRVKR